MRKPIIVVGAGPVGLTTALGLDFYRLPFLLFEDDAELSRDTKAGTILTRRSRRFGVMASPTRSWPRRCGSTRSATSSAPPTRRGRRCRPPCSAKTRAIRSSSTCRSITSSRSCAMPSTAPARCAAPAASPDLVSTDRRRRGRKLRDARRQARRRGLVPPRPATAGAARCATQLGVAVEGESSDVRCLLVDVNVDLDVANPRDYPYLAYFADPQEWMILVRQPHCWRFLYPLGRRGSRADDGRVPRQGHPLHRSRRRDGNPQHHRLPHPSPHRERNGGTIACS